MAFQEGFIMAFRLVCAALTLMLSAGLAEAKTAKATQVVYDCKTGDTTANSLFSAEYLVIRDPKTGAVQVLDGLVQMMFGKPIDAKIKRENDAVLVLGWTVKNVVNSRNQYATLNFTLAMQKADNSSTIQLQPLGYANVFENRGTCGVQ